MPILQSVVAWMKYKGNQLEVFNGLKFDCSSQLFAVLMRGLFRFLLSNLALVHFRLLSTAVTLLSWAVLHPSQPC